MKTLNNINNNIRIKHDFFLQITISNIVLFFFRNFLQLPKEEINKLEWKIEKRKRKSKIKKIKINKINHLIYYVFCYFVCFYFL